jgi:hypothetical protein
VDKRIGRVHVEETTLKAVKPVAWRVAGVQRDIVEVVYSADDLWCLVS